MSKELIYPLGLVLISLCSAFWLSWYLMMPLAFIWTGLLLRRKVKVRLVWSVIIPFMSWFVAVYAIDAQYVKSVSQLFEDLEQGFFTNNPKITTGIIPALVSGTAALAAYYLVDKPINKEA